MLRKFNSCTYLTCKFFPLLFLVQQPNLSHPFHLHGYGFSVVGIGRSPDMTVKKINLKHALDLDRRGLLNRQYNLPPTKDTIAVPNNGYVVLRFRADNPGKSASSKYEKKNFHFYYNFFFFFFLSSFTGFWLFHCHFLFHIVIGMNLILQVGTNADLPPVPPGFPTCGDHTPPIPIN